MKKVKKTELKKIKAEMKSARHKLESKLASQRAMIEETKKKYRFSPDDENTYDYEASIPRSIK